MNKIINIAIDGPAGAGKSTLARKLAADLQLVYVDTGAMYRTIGLYMARCGVDATDAAAVEARLPEINLELRYVDGVQCMILNGEDVSRAIRTEEASVNASKVSAIPAVRAFLLETQRGLARKCSVIMDGRDIGTVILPNADLKIFLTASAEERAKRRYTEQVERGEKVSYEEILREIQERDIRDTTRATAPLKPAEDAVTLDTPGHTLEDSLAIMKALLKERVGLE